jgi:hypothetical protein
VWFVFVHDREVERTLRQVWHCVCILPSQYRMQRQVRLLIDCCDRAHGCATAESLGLLKIEGVYLPANWNFPRLTKTLMHLD